MTLKNQGMVPIPSGDLPLLSIAQTQLLLDSGKVAYADLAEAFVTRCRRLRETLNCFEDEFYESVLAASRLGDENQPPGVLRGVYLGLKDNITSSEGSTSNGFRRAPTVQPGVSTIDRRLRAADASVLGKLGMPEGAFTEHLPERSVPRNPWDPALWPGTSSSGAGVAVASGLVHAAIGTDTGGSLRFPAACNGVTSLRPSYGGISRYGVFPLAPSFDQPGIIARSAQDVQTVFDTVAGWDPLDVTTIGTNSRSSQLAAGAIVVGVDTAWTLEDVGAFARSGMQNAILALENTGIAVRETVMPDAHSIADDWWTIAAYEARLAYDRMGLLEDMAPKGDLRQFLEAGYRIQDAAYFEAQERRERYRQAVLETFEGVDCVLTPVLPDGVPTAASLETIGPAAINRLHKFVGIAPFAALPALTLPSGDEEPVPPAVQLLGHPNGDRMLLSIGIALQETTRWHLLHPPVD
ncbi:amidase [Arthrobacter sp. AB6]|uniref:amidase n=1 Tax=Arthrobacter sp. AB6 TaxID=2962570 RepID=UPI002881CE17|nr:amidase [Arthrobacter sp. AB6]MDT0196464.1 amidase [Arthrobacter sp. AB6]